MRLRDMTIDELIDEEERLQDLIEEDGRYGYSGLVQVYEAMIKRYKRDRERESVSFVEKKLIQNLINYGAYLKMGNEKRTRDAIDSLQKAIALHNRLPVAHYRLGFLYSRDHHYTEAASHFDKAIDLQQIAKEIYRLDERQLYYAHLYEINSCLHQAYETYQKMNSLDLEERYDPLGSEGMSALYERLLESDAYLANREFVKVTNEGEEYCSKAECEEIAGNPDPDRVVLYFNDRGVELFHGNLSTHLQFTRADVLRDLILYSGKHPFDGERLAKLRDRLEPSSNSTVTQNISRLRRQLEDVGLSEAIEQRDHKYFFRPDYPYTVLYRPDEKASV
ncbi:hypothetical protein H0266_14970 [Halobacillus locisalis]|uniref:Tetratricopeptide repeat-containing protein n=1 Tax=Halobacillus locisalis TaxID=220753 RepID=A0A838CVX0_9BACI|nr:hypothetical protein [Halobacillus locisalis]MBA2176197.1 hypothetical protein [Halobacillus locisalis]